MICNPRVNNDLSHDDLQTEAQSLPQSIQYGLGEPHLDETSVHLLLFCMCSLFRTPLMLLARSLKVLHAPALQGGIRRTSQTKIYILETNEVAKKTSRHFHFVPKKPRVRCFSVCVLFRTPCMPPAGSLKVLHAPALPGGIRRASQTKIYILETDELAKKNIPPFPFRSPKTAGTMD